MKRTKIILSVSVLALLAGGFFFKDVLIPVAETKTIVSEKVTASRPVLAVEIVSPRQDVWPMTLKTHGALAAWQDVAVSAETGGLRIAALHAEVGDTVEAGALLAELDDRTVKADLMKMEAQVALAQAQLREALANAKRGRQVKGTGALSSQQIEQFEVALLVAQANLDAAKAGAQSARIRLSQTRIVALDAGVVSARSATLGTVVNAGSELFRLVRRGKVEWRAEIDAKEATRAQPGQKATIMLPAGEALEGVVRTLSPTLDAKTRTALAYVDLPAHEHGRAGSYVSGEIDLGTTPALNLPASAVVLRDGRSLVFEVQGDVVIQRNVMTGRNQGDRIEILEGLATDAKVVRSGGAFLNDGDRVRIAGEGGSDRGAIADTAGEAS